MAGSRPAFRAGRCTPGATSMVRAGDRRAGRSGILPGTVLATCVVLGLPGNALALRAVDAPTLDPGDRVVCLFDSSEGATASRNPLSGAVADALRRQGFRAEFVDVAAAVPSRTSVAGARAVLTGFSDGRLARARDFIAFLRDAASSGVRVVVLGNFGAWQDAAEEGFLPADVVNRAFLALGVRYQADWTDDPARFSVRVEDPALGPADAVKSSDTRHYYRFTPARPDVRVMVSGTRAGDAGPSSALVFTSATGAMALSRYLSADEAMADARSARLDLDAFLRAALARRPLDPATLLVVTDPSDEDARQALAAIRAAASYAGTPLAAVPVGAASALRPADLDSYAGLVLAVSEVPSPLDEYLAGLVRNLAVGGGRALSVLPLRDPPLVAAFGGQGFSPASYQSSGLRFGAGAFPGLDGFAIDLPTPDRKSVV